jgi:flagellar motor protein MotB
VNTRRWLFVLAVMALPLIACENTGNLATNEAPDQTAIEQQQDLDAQEAATAGQQSESDSSEQDLASEDQASEEQGAQEQTGEEQAAQEQAAQEQAGEAQGASAKSIPADLRDYLTWAAGIAGQLTDPIQVISEQSTLAGKDATVIFDQDWIIKTAAALASFQVTATQIREREDVPDEAEAVHGIMLELADELDSIATNYSQGVDNLDASLIAAATDSMVRAGELAVEMSDEVQRISEEYGLD